MTIHLATRKFQLVQVGPGRVPQLEAQTDLSYQARLTQIEMESGATYDAYSKRNAPIALGHVKCSGLYPLCTYPQGITDGEMIRQEIDYLMAAKQAWTPFLFYTNLYRPPVTLGNRFADCGTFLWAYGKITNASNLSATSDYLSPKASLVEFEGVLRTPLVPVTYARWRYGIKLSPAVGQYALPNDLETANAEAKALWYVPCEIPSFCNNSERMWPRNLYSDNFNTGSIEFDPDKWECPYLMLQNVATNAINVNGNTQPRTRVFMRGDATLQISNSLGTFTYFYDRSPFSTIYADSWTGVVIERDVNYNEAPVPGAGFPPQLNWAENLVSIAGGFATIGATEAWIN